MWKRVCGLAAVLSLTCGIGEALPRQVRIIWNVDAGSACVHVLKDRGQTPRRFWEMPPMPVDGTTCPAIVGYHPPAHTPLWKVEVEKGDAFTVYAVHYNPVLYKPKDPKAVVFKPEEPAIPELLRLAEGRLRLGMLATTTEPGKPGKPAKPGAIDEPCSFSDMGRANACLNVIGAELDAVRQLLSTIDNNIFRTLQGERGAVSTSWMPIACAACCRSDP